MSRLMEQYNDIRSMFAKNEKTKFVIFFLMGDYYEVFGEDAMFAGMAGAKTDVWTTEGERIRHASIKRSESTEIIKALENAGFAIRVYLSRGKML